MRCFFGIGLLLGAVWPLAASAHGFGRLYNLPVPFWLYAWAASAALLVSFLLALYFVRRPEGPEPEPTTRTIRSTGGWVRLKSVLQVLSVGLLVLCIATALWGNRDPYRNFSMTFFWIVCLLGLTYFTAVAGNVYAYLNPWSILTGWLVLVYTLINVIAAGLVGRQAWFRHGEFFAVYLRLVGRLAPLRLGGEDHLRQPAAWRWPGAGLVHSRPAHMATVVFILAMLSTTAFDGLRATQWWVRLFWSDPTGWVEALMGQRPMQNVIEARRWYLAWETLWLLSLPGVYFAAYAGSLQVARWMTGSQRPLRALLLDFAYPLLPIALAYHVTHYATLVLTQGRKIISLASDPFGWGWDLFGTAMTWRAPFLPEMSWVWHSQVALILIGHVAGVYASHRVAIRVFETPRSAALSQIALLVLMVAMTVSGLWIIAQPLTVERMT
ncbi:MAG: hypothetical protein CMH65_14295 [Nevskiales bacterium]|nr:hypothetical protein [Nevskiales bacterium]